MPVYGFLIIIKDKHSQFRRGLLCGRFRVSFPGVTLNPCFDLFLLELDLPHSRRTIRGMVTSFRRNDFWDRMSGQALVISRYILFKTTISQS